MSEKWWGLRFLVEILVWKDPNLLEHVIGKNMNFLLNFNQNQTASVNKPYAQKNVY